ELGDRGAAVIGSSIGNLQDVESDMRTMWERGPRRGCPFATSRMLPNMAAAEVAYRTGSRGPQGCPATTGAAGAQAIGDAARLIAGGYADIALAGASEATIGRSYIAAFGNSGVLSQYQGPPKRACRPFDMHRDG